MWKKIAAWVGWLLASTLAIYDVAGRFLGRLSVPDDLETYVLAPLREHGAPRLAPAMLTWDVARWALFAFASLTLAWVYFGDRAVSMFRRGRIAAALRGRSIDCYLNEAVLYVAEGSEWSVWYTSQKGAAPRGMMLYTTAGFLLTQAAAAGKIVIHGRPPGDPKFMPIDRKHWALAALRVDPDVGTIVRVRTMARSPLEPELADNLPMYVGLHTDWAGLMELYPPKAEGKRGGPLSRWRARLSGSR